MDLAIDQTSARTRAALSVRIAGVGLRAISDIGCNEEIVAERRIGHIVIEAGRLLAVYGRWWPYYGNMLQTYLDVKMRPVQADRCELFYHQSLSAAGFLTLAYVRSGPRTSLSSFYGATLVLDEVARVKRANAIVSHVTNSRITDRLLQRWGWQQHCLDWPGRHFIKRFYGVYPSISPHWRSRLQLGCI